MSNEKSNSPWRRISLLQCSLWFWQSQSFSFRCFSVLVPNAAWGATVSAHLREWGELKMYEELSHSLWQTFCSAEQPWEKDKLLLGSKRWEKRGSNWIVLLMLSTLTLKTNKQNQCNWLNSISALILGSHFVLALFPNGKGFKTHRVIAVPHIFWNNQ